MSMPYPELIADMPIVQSAWLEDTKAYVSTNYDANGRRPVLLVGAKPPEGLDAVRREARLIVRHGLADVLDWLGQPVINEPVMAVLRVYQDETGQLFATGR
jgi:hypothetical protein